MAIDKNEPKSRQVTVLIRPSVYKIIHQMGLDQDRSTSYIVNWMLEQYIVEHEKDKEE